MLLLRRILQQEEVVSRMKSPEHSTLIQENLRAFAGTTLAFKESAADANETAQVQDSRLRKEELI